MFINYLLTALRSIKVNKIYSLINITGFAIGLASCLLILLYVYNEISFEWVHKQRRQIYRVAMNLKHGDSDIPFAATMSPLAPALKEVYPEVIDYVRIRQIQETAVEYNKTAFTEKNLVYTEPSFFNIFSYKLALGDEKTALSNAFSVIISDNIARKYFGDRNPLGERITINDNDYSVTGVMKKYRGNSQLNFDFLISYSTLVDLGQYSDNWVQMGTDHCFILLPEKADVEVFKGKLKDIVSKNIYPPFSQMITLELQPMRDIYFKSRKNNEFEPRGDIKQVYIFSLIAGLLMFIAILNFINLSTARLLQRSKEVGMRKIFGAHRVPIILQFLVESVLITFFSMLVGLVVFCLLYPALNSYIGRPLTVNYLTSPLTLLILFVLSVIIGISSGLYPAIYLSKPQPLEILQSRKGKERVFFRTIMVIIQFSIAIILIFATIIIYKQLHFLRNSDTGFEKDNILIVHLNDMQLNSKYEILQGEFKSIPLVEDMTVCFSSPGSPAAMIMNTKEESASQEEGFMITAIPCDYNYIPFFGLHIEKGRNFSQEYTSDADLAVIINESAADKLGSDEPLGKKLIVPSAQGETVSAEVIGVVRDFHFNSLKTAITPQLFFIRPDNYMSFAFKYTDGKSEELIEELRLKWEKVIKDSPFDYSFLEDDYNALYKTEEKMGKLFIFFSALIIFIACLGIFGLALFMAEQRTKEIGIRKVHGASQSGLIYMLIQDFAKCVLAANVIALPLGYYLMQKWLSNYSGKTEISVWVYFVSGVIALVIALLTVSIQSYRTAARNPVETLKYE